MTPSKRESEATEARFHTGFFEEVVDTAGIGIGIYGADGRFEYVNEAYADLLGDEPEAIEEMAIWEINPRFEQERFDGYWHSFADEETRTAETVHAIGERTVPVQTITTCKEIDGTTYHFGVVQDITEQRAQETQFRAFVEQSNDVLSILDRDGSYRYQSPSVERVLGYDADAMLGENAFEYVHPDDRTEVRAQFERAFTDPDATPVVEHRFQHADGSWRWIESRGNNQFDNPAVDGFVVNSRDITERKKYEIRIADLHDATREMVHASEERDICRIAVRTFEGVLEFPITGIWLADDGGDRLEPVATTDTAVELVGDQPVFTDGNSISWRAYASGETIVSQDLDEEPRVYNPDSALQSELVVPLGSFGVLNVGSTEPDAFTDNDVALAKLLAANVLTALVRAERERSLERQTDQMEFFNSILRHDVLNAVTVIKSRAQFLAADLDGQQGRDAETIVTWSDEVDDIVQQVRTVLDTLTGAGDPERKPVVLADHLQPEIDRVRSTYSDVSVAADVPEDTVVLANELLGTVLGNIVTNAVEHNETVGLTVRIDVEERDGAVRIRIADDGRGVPDDQREAIFRRDETGHAKSTGSGFGLFFVDVMVRGYGGDVRVDGNDEGGATFLVELQPASSEPPTEGP